MVRAPAGNLSVRGGGIMKSNAKKYLKQMLRFTDKILIEIGIFTSQNIDEIFI